MLTQRPVYIEVSLTGIAGLKSLTVITGLLLKARHKRGFWGNPVSQSMHYAARAMGAMTLRISQLCLSFSPHPIISDGNVNLVHHFFRI